MEFTPEQAAVYRRLKLMRPSWLALDADVTMDRYPIFCFLHQRLPLAVSDCVLSYL